MRRQIDDNQIEMTEDYDMFRKLLGNREIDQAHKTASDGIRPSLKSSAEDLGIETILEKI